MRTDPPPESKQAPELERSGRPARSCWAGRRAPFLLIAGLVSLGLMVDFGWLASHPPGLESGETLHWWPIVLNVAHGKGFEGCSPGYFPGCESRSWPTAAREPLPVLLFAGVASLTSDSLNAAAVTEIGLDLLVLAVLFLLAREVGGEALGAVTGLAWIFYLPAKKLIPQVSGELPAALGIVLGLLLFVLARRKGGDLLWIASGAAIGLAALSRSSSLVIAPTLMLAVGVLPQPGVGRRRLRPLLLVGGSVALLVLPWIARNYETFGRPIVGTTLVGYNLYRENQQLDRRDYLRFVAGGEAARAVNRLVERRAELRHARNEAEMDSVYFREASRIISRHPLRYGLLFSYRFPALWLDWGHKEAYGARPRLDDYLLMGEQALLLVLALAGLRRLGSRGIPLAASVAALCLIHMAVISQLRFLVPVMPLVMILSSAGFLAFVAGDFSPTEPSAPPSPPARGRMV
jgi:4-amino-4-deoxy-L-arabinose transferase-like glycosyltransferase